MAGEETDAVAVPEAEALVNGSSSGDASDISPSGSQELHTTSNGDVVVDMKEVDEAVGEMELREVHKPGQVDRQKSMYYAGKSIVKNTALLDPIPSSREVTLTFTNVSSWVPNLMIPQAGKKAPAGDGPAPPAKRQILHSVSGAACPGEVLALMGPSGSGKTSLISILGGRAASIISTKGQIEFNGQAPGKSMKRKMGFVLQDDLLYENLTVHETLYYAAQLRLPKSMSKAEKTDRVDKVIQALGLDRCVNTIIGGFMRRGVSGGERKRVSVGHELLINPSIIFLDEPTSGLDSTTALALVNTLYGLATGGRTVITTIHQPSSRMFQKLDKLMLLSEGHLLYYGSNNSVVDWFKGLQAPCPFGINVADFILDLASANQGTTKEEGEEIRALQVNAFKQLTKHETWNVDTGVTADSAELAAYCRTAVLENNVSKMGSDEVLPEKLGLASRLSSMASRNGRESEDGMGSEGNWGSNWMTQFMVLFSRAMKVRRFDSLSSQKFLQLGIVAFVTGLFWWQRGGVNTLAAAQDTMGLLFFETLFMAFQSMFAALFVFPNEIRMVMKERSSGMYRLSAYYLSRTMSDLPMDCFYPSIFVFIIYFMGGLRLTAGAFFANWMTVMLALLTAQSLGLLLGAGVTNVKTAQTFATVFMLTIMLIGGYYVSYVPVWIAWVKYLSFIYYTYNILVHIEFGGRDFVDCTPCQNLPGGCGADNQLCEPVNLQTDLGLQKNPDAGVGLDVGLMFVLLFVMRIAIYFVLNAKTKQRRRA